MFISESNLKDLKNKLNDNKNKVDRILLHEKNSQNIQLMCIAFKENVHYHPIADLEKGCITFIVLEGKLKINTYNISDQKKIASQIICPKEIYKIPRNIFRETISISNSETIFFEIIEGPYDPNNRISMD